MEKDNYPLPSLDEVLQLLNRSQIISFLDVLFGYNQVIIDKEDKFKTSFTTKWGTCGYKRMPFSLIKFGTIFQCAMDISFKDLIGKFIIIYMNEFIIFSKKYGDHVKYLRKVLKKYE